MIVCLSCGRENPDEAAFCNACATALTSSASAREQRKTVTVLFCDLVGSTTLAESLDPEVLRPLLQRYFKEMRTAVDSRALIDITRDMLALAICGQGRFGEADELGRESERKRLHPADVNAQNVWRRVRARTLSARGEHGDAVRFAREAEGFFAESDALNDHGECLLDLAGVLRRAGEIDDAAAAAREALSLYERKENVVEAARARALLSELAGRA